MREYCDAIHSFMQSRSHQVAFDLVQRSTNVVVELPVGAQEKNASKGGRVNALSWRLKGGSVVALR